MFLEHLDDGTWTVSGCLNDTDALIYHNLGVFLVWRRIYGREESDIHTKRVAGHLLALLDLFAEFIWCWLCEGCDDTETTGIGDC